ncbi:MAG: hypothetical protein ACON4Z_04840 [Planctomycetota bacterium]
MRHALRLGALALLLVGCASPPPRPWLRYELDGPTQLQQQRSGRFVGDVAGVQVTLDLHDQRTRLLATVENRGEGSVAVSLGPDAGAPDRAIGEVLLRQVDGPASGGPEMAPYAAMAPLALDGGWRATFFLDRPLGRDIKLGQYFVFAVEVVGEDGSKQRVRLPVVGKMGGVDRDASR